MDAEKIIFDQKELEKCKVQKGLFGPIYALNTPISVRENFDRFLKGNPLWMPSSHEMKFFNPLIIPENKARGMIAETKQIPPAEFGGKDFFDVEWEFVPTVRGSMVRPGTPKVPDICEWEKYISFPDLSKYDWDGCAASNQEYLDAGKLIQTTVYTGFFERLISFLDMEEALIAMIDEDEKNSVHRLFDRLADFYCELIGYIGRYFHRDCIWFHDDWGSQRAPMFSINVVREMIVPYLKRVVDAAHKEGMIFEMHSCGKNQDLVPCYIEAGADMWTPQLMNDVDFIVREYGQDLKIGVEPGYFQKEPLPRDASDAQLRDVARKMMDRFPKNVYFTRAFAYDSRFYEIVYEESRIRYNQ